MASSQLVDEIENIPDDSQKEISRPVRTDAPDEIIHQYSINSTNEFEDQDVTVGPLITPNRQLTTFENDLPTIIGWVQILTGALLIISALAEIFILPLTFSSDIQNSIKFGVAQLYGLGFWLGILAILTGCLAVRATVFKTDQLVYIYYLFNLASLTINIAAVIIILRGLSLLPGIRHELSAVPGCLVAFSATCILTFVVFIEGLFVFIQHGDTVFWGEFRLCHRIMFCLCPCICRPIWRRDHNDEPCPSVF